MTTINLITPPDKIHNDSASILTIFPSRDVQNYLQQEVLPDVPDSLNLYYFDRSQYSDEDVAWLLDVFSLCDYCVIDVDNSPAWLRDLFSYFIGKSKTYWLTNVENSVYNHISRNRIYDLNFLKNIGD